MACANCGSADHWALNCPNGGQAKSAVDRQIENDAMIAKNIMKRMGDAAEQTIDDQVTSPGGLVQRHGVTQMDFDKMMGQSLQMKRMQQEMEETKTEVTTMKRGLRGVQEEVTNLGNQTNGKLDRITSLLEGRSPREGTPLPSTRRYNEDGSSGTGGRTPSSGGSARSAVPTRRNLDHEIESLERLDLARAEADAAEQAGRAAEAGRAVPPTPEETYGHIPAPVRNLMSIVSSAVVDRSVHIKFARYVGCENHQKTASVASLIDSETHLPWSRYFDLLGKCKSLTQWKAKGLSLSIPSEAILSTRAVADMGRLLFIKFAADAEMGDIVSADMKSRDAFIRDQAREWMEL